MVTIYDVFDVTGLLKYSILYCKKIYIRNADIYVTIFDQVKCGNIVKMMW